MRRGRRVWRRRAAEARRLRREGTRRPEVDKLDIGASLMAMRAMLYLHCPSKRLLLCHLKKKKGRSRADRKSKMPPAQRPAWADWQSAPRFWQGGFIPASSRYYDG